MKRSAHGWRRGLGEPCFLLAFGLGFDFCLLVAATATVSTDTESPWFFTIYG